MLQQAIVENVQREELNPLEEAAAYQQLIEDFSLTHDDVATRVGKSRATDHEHVATAAAPAGDPAVREGRHRCGWATPGRCSARPTARSRSSSPSAPSPRTSRCARSRRRSGPARSTDRPTRAAGARARPKLRPPGLLELEELLGDYLETRVRITMGPRRGKVEVEFATLEDLERIYRAITEGRRHRRARTDRQGVTSSGARCPAGSLRPIASRERGHEAS